MQEGQHGDADGGDQKRHREELFPGQELQRGSDAGNRAGHHWIHAPAHEDLVAEQQRDRREQGHHDVGMAERLRDQRGAEAVEEAGREACQLAVDESACGQESKPGRKGEAGGDQEVVGHDRTESGGDRPEQQRRKDHRRVPHEIHAARIRQIAGEERVVPQAQLMRQPAEVPDEQLGVFWCADQGTGRVDPRAGKERDGDQEVDEEGALQMPGVEATTNPSGVRRTPRIPGTSMINTLGTARRMAVPTSVVGIPTWSATGPQIANPAGIAIKESSQSNELARARTSAGSSCGTVANQTSFKNVRPANASTPVAMITIRGEGPANVSASRAASVSARLATTRGRRGITRNAMRPPTTEPAPIEAPIRPQADAPPRCCLAMIGPSTNRAAIAKFHNAWEQRLIRYHVRLETACHPAAISAQKLVFCLAGITGTRSIASDSALTMKVSASI